MRLSWPEIRANAAAFSEEWKNKGYEKGQTQTFYDEFFAVFGVPRKQVAVYEQRVASDRERVEHLFTLYQRLVDPLGNEGVRQNRRVARRARSTTAENG